LGVKGLIQKSKKKFCRVPHGELMAEEWLNSIEKRKRRSDLKFAVTDGQTEIHTDKPVGD